jgi:hypothetical protein
MYISSNLERELSAGDKALRYRIAMDIVQGKHYARQSSEFQTRTESSEQ